MMIVDAIESAPSPHAIFFLLTAYIESLRHFQASSCVPERALRLPIQDRKDLEARLQTVHDDINGVVEAVVPVREAAAVLSSGIRRLIELEAAQCPELRAA